jgi:hypothetical protein
MKKLLTIFTLATFVLTSCSSDDAGPQGPPGPPGPPGEDGLGYTFEETITFDYFSDVNLYSQFITIPEEIVTPNPSADAVLVYRLEIVEINGEDTDTWSLIPQNFFLEEGTMQYVYAHTVNDVEVIIDGNFDLSNLDSDYTENQTFRVIVLPSDGFDYSSLNKGDYDAVMNALDNQGVEVLNIQQEK